MGVALPPWGLELLLFQSLQVRVIGNDRYRCSSHQRDSAGEGNTASQRTTTEGHTLRT